MVSICGGEPLIYPQIEALVDGLLAQGRIVYLCTNATAMRRKMRDYLAWLHLRRRCEAEELMHRERIPMLDTTAKSIEEIATTILHRAELARHIY